jgi:hypothetical protein
MAIVLLSVAIIQWIGCKDNERPLSERDCAISDY